MRAQDVISANPPACLDRSVCVRRSLTAQRLISAHSIHWPVDALRSLLIDAGVSNFALGSVFWALCSVFVLLSWYSAISVTMYVFLIHRLFTRRSRKSRQRCIHAFRKPYYVQSMLTMLGIQSIITLFSVQHALSLCSLC